MKTRYLAAVAALGFVSAVSAVEIPSVTSGDWSNPATWTGGNVPDVAANDPLVGEDAIVRTLHTVTISGDQAARRLYVGEDATTDSTTAGIVNMTGGTLTIDGIYIGTDLDNSGAGATNGYGIFNLIDGTINLNENINGALPFQQGLVIGSDFGASGVFTMGDVAGTTSPTVNVVGGRFEVGGNPVSSGNNPGATNGTFEFRSGTVNNNQPFIIGQNNNNGDTGTVIVGGFPTPAVLNVDNPTNNNRDLNFNRNGTLTINDNGSVFVDRDFQFSSANGAPNGGRAIINPGGTLTVQRYFNDRGGRSALELRGGTLSFLNGSDASVQTFKTTGGGQISREVENLVIDDSSTLQFAIDGDVTNGIMPLLVGGDDQGPTFPASLLGNITIEPVLAQTDPGGGGNTAVEDAWTAGAGTWDTTNPNDANWSLGFAPENAGGVSIGTSFQVLAYNPTQNAVAVPPRWEFPFSGANALAQGNADGEFDVAGLTSITATGDWVVTTVQSNVGADMAVLNYDSDGDGYPVAYAVERINSVGKVPPATAVFDTFDTVTAGTGSADLVIGRYVGADAGALTIRDSAGFTVTNDLVVGGVEGGIVNHGDIVTTTSFPLEISLTVNGNLVFGNDGTWDPTLGTPAPEGGTYNLNDGTLTVLGDIVEGEPGLPDADVIDAQLLINNGTTAANALQVTGSVTVQRLAVGSAPFTTAGLTISAAAGLPAITTTGTTSIGAGENGLGDGDPLNVSGSTGEVVVDSGGTLTAQSLNVAEDGDSVGSLTINSGGVVTVGGRVYVAGDQTTAADGESVGSITVNSGGTFTVQTGNVEIGRDGQGSLTVDGGTFTIVGDPTTGNSNLVLSQDGTGADADLNSGQGNATFTNGATIIIGTYDSSDGINSNMNINEGGGTITIDGGSSVAVENTVLFSDLNQDSTCIVDSATLTVGNDISFRGGTALNSLVLSGTAMVSVGVAGEIDDTVAGSDILMAGGAGDSNLLSLNGSSCVLDVWDDLRADASSRLKWVSDGSGISSIRVGLMPVGDVADTTADRVGVIQLNNANLELDFTAGSPAAPVTLIENADVAAAPAVGTFSGLPEGANISGTLFAITYTGGDGNDVQLITSPDPDFDGDGMVKSYEDANGLSDTDPSDATSDNDGDGFEALFEYIVGTLAGDASSSPVWTIGDASTTLASQVELTYGPVTTGVSYIIRGSLDGSTFPAVIDNFAATTDTTVRSVLDGLDNSVELYQLEALFTP